MVHPNEVNKIRRMTFNQLRNELAYCEGNPTKELLIRNIMREKYIRYKKRKRAIEEKRRQKNISKRVQNPQNPLDSLEPSTYQEVNNFENDYIKSILDDVEEPVSLRDEDVNIFPKHGSLDELEDTRLNKFKNEVDKDFMNNNLMDRLNSDIDIRKTNKKNKRDFVPPFSNDVGGCYAPFRHDKEIPQSDFSNKRILRDNY